MRITLECFFSAATSRGEIPFTLNALTSAFLLINSCTTSTFQAGFQLHKTKQSVSFYLYGQQLHLNQEVFTQFLDILSHRQALKQFDPLQPPLHSHQLLLKSNILHRLLSLQVSESCTPLLNLVMLHLDFSLVLSYSTNQVIQKHDQSQLLKLFILVLSKEFHFPMV